MRPKIVFKNVIKGFNVYKKQSDKLLELISLKKQKENFFAVRDLSFEIFEGESIGIVGLNGSGKSTMCNLLAQVIPATSGHIEINGETSLIAIAAGLNNSLSGIENIELKCLMHGLRKSEIEKLKPKIIEFADLGKFIYQPVKNYSSGMKSKLGFAISVHINPDIMIIDEALSVGDQTFYKKCIDKMNQFREQGKTIVFISHSLSQVEGFCDKVLWMNFGQIEKFGETKEVLSDYKNFINWFNKLPENEKKAYRAEKLAEQYKGKELDLNNEARLSKKAKKARKKARTGFVFQLSILTFAVIISASFMFGARPVEGLTKILNQTFKEERQTEVINENMTSKYINENGIIVSQQAYLYDNQELNQKVRRISFFDEVFVKEQIGDSYKVSVNGELRYIPKEDILIINENLAETNQGLEEFLPLFPEQFVGSYQYFLSFLNTDADEVKSSIRETPIEQRNMLNYANYYATYNINQENIAQSITISNINTSIPEFNDIKNSAFAQDGYFLFNMKERQVLIDILSKELTIIVKND